MSNKLLNIKEVSDLLNVSQDSLRRWDASGKLVALRTGGGHRRYALKMLDAFTGCKTLEGSKNLERVAIYCRVSSQDQKNSGDLDRQKVRLLEYCVKKDYKVGFILEEVCSGMKSKRPKLNKLYSLAINKEITKVIVEHKDRLTRFMFDIFQVFFSSYGVEVEVVQEVLPKSFENELVEDMLSLLSSFSSRIYGKRSAERRKQKKAENDKADQT